MGYETDAGKRSISKLEFLALRIGLEKRSKRRRKLVRAWTRKARQTIAVKPEAAVAVAGHAMTRPLLVRPAARLAVKYASKSGTPAACALLHMTHDTLLSEGADPAMTGKALRAILNREANVELAVKLAIDAIGKPGLSSVAAHYIVANAHRASMVATTVRAYAAASLAVAPGSPDAKIIAGRWGGYFKQKVGSSNAGAWWLEARDALENPVLAHAAHDALPTLISRLNSLGIPDACRALSQWAERTAPGSQAEIETLTAWGQKVMSLPPREGDLEIKSTMDRCYARNPASNVLQIATLVLGRDLVSAQAMAHPRP